MNLKINVDTFDMKVYNSIQNECQEGENTMRLDRTQLDIAVANAGVPSYRQLAQLVGCSAQNLSVIINRGTCKPMTAVKIAHALRVPVESIIRKEE